MNKIEEILRAWSISFNPNDAQASLAAMRIHVCNSCEFKASIKVSDTELLRRCTLCGCGLKGKIYTPKTYKDPGGSCPKDRWKYAEDIWLQRQQLKKELQP